MVNNSSLGPITSMKFIGYLIFILLLSITTGCVNKSSPEYVARQYLIALKNKDWETAKKYSSKEAAQNLDLMKEFGTDFGLTDVKDIKCKVRSNQAECTFCCSDSDFYCVDLLKRDGEKWKVVMPKDGGCRGPYSDDSLDLKQNYD